MVQCRAPPQRVSATSRPPNATPAKATPSWPHATRSMQARDDNPARWSGPTHNCSQIGVVTLNPERDAVVATDAAQKNSPWLQD